MLHQIIYSNLIYFTRGRGMDVISPQENASLITNFSDQKLFVTIMTNLDTNLQSKKLLVTKIVTIMNNKL